MAYLFPRWIAAFWLHGQGYAAVFPPGNNTTINRSSRRWLRNQKIDAVIPEKQKPHRRKAGWPPRLNRNTYKCSNVVERRIAIRCK